MTSMNDLPKDKENAGAQQCEHCQFTEDYKFLSFGHTKCARHRLCSGARRWEPGNCYQCQIMIAKVETETSANRLEILNQVKTFLDLAKQKIEHSNPHQSWDYKAIYEFTFRRLNVSQPPQASTSGAAGHKMADVASGVMYPETGHLRFAEDRLLTEEQYRIKHAPSPPRNISPPIVKSPVAQWRTTKPKVKTQ